MAMPPTPNPRQPLRPSSPLVRYGLALLIAGLTVAIRWWLEPLVGSRHAFLGGNLAVALVAYRYGTGPALAALVAIGAAFFWLFVVPTAEFRGAPAGPRGHAVYTPLFNYCQVPACSVPVGLVDGLPVGMQIVAPEFADLSTIWLAEQLAGLIGGFVPPPGY